MRNGLNNGFGPFLFACGEDETKEAQWEYVLLFAGCQSVLDLACGRGFFLDLLNRVGIQGEGVDHESTLVEACKARGHKAETVDVLTFLRDTDRRFDGIMVSHLIEHFSGEDGLELLRLASRQLTPGGRLVVVTPNTENDEVMRRNFWLDWHHKRPIPRLLLVAQLEKFGLQIGPNGSSPIARQWFKRDLMRGLQRCPRKTLRELYQRFVNNGLTFNFLLGDTYVVGIKPAV